MTQKLDYVDTDLWHFLPFLFQLHMILQPAEMCASKQAHFHRYLPLQSQSTTKI